jgi:HNH endonuclease
MSKVYPHVCPECLVAFSNTDKRSKYCSRDCYFKASVGKIKSPVEPISKICDYCRNPFMCKRETRRFCSLACRYASANTGHVDFQGYRKIHVNGKRVREHRYVMEQHIGRPLQGDENVHHINKDKSDNRIENLRLFSTVSEHLKVEHDLNATETHRECCICHEFKPRTEFSLASEAKGKPFRDPNMSGCKKCVAKRKLDYYYSRPARTTEDGTEIIVKRHNKNKTDTHKECSTCHEFKERANFRPNSRFIEGGPRDAHLSECRECERQRERNRIRKKAVL